MKRLKNLFIFVSTVFLFGISLNNNLFAQTITATLSGVVNDPNGAIVQGATVSITSNETGLSKTVTTNEDGRYVLTFLQPGVYTIKVEKQGFAETITPNIKLETGQSASLNLTLQISAAEVSVDVSAGDQTQLLNTESSALDTTIENKLVEDLPTGERSALAFVNLVPGTIDAGFAQARGEGLNENGNAQGPIGSPGNRNFFDSNFSVNGGRSSTNDVLLDGVSNTVGDFNGVAVSPPQDSIREFKVVAGSYSSEFGRSGGGVVSIVTKSGGKRYSGALYEYYQDGNFNANGWQRNRRGVRSNGEMVLPRIDIVRHQYGGSFGGPVQFFNFGEGDPGKMISKLEKTFFFFNYEGRYEKNPFSREITVPTAKMRTGDFSELLGATVSGQTNTDGTPARAGQIYNPYGALVGGRRVYFPNNSLAGLPTCAPSGPRTSACLDPVALAVLNFIPLPNVSGTANNYVFSEKADFRRDIYAGRIDHTFSDKHSAFFRLSYENRFQSEPNFFGGSVAANVRIVKDKFLNFTFNDVYSLTGTIVNNFRYGYTRVRANQIPESQGFDPTSLGLPAYLKDRAAILKFPDFNIGSSGAGATPAGEVTSGQIGGAGNNQPRDTHTVANGITWVRGNHTIKMGAEYRLLRFFPYQFFNPTGSFTFSRSWTSGPTPSTTTTTFGAALASFLLGLPSAGNHETIVPVTIYHNYGAGYFQDDWKIRPRLTLNLGLRWDFETGTSETHGLITNFDINARSPLQGSQAAVVDPFVRELNNSNQSNLKGLLKFLDGPQTKTNYDRFAPRVGFAYSINDKTTIRGGYGMFYVPTSVEVTSAQGVNFNTALAQSTQTSQVTASTTFLTNPYPTGIPAPPGTSLGDRTRLGQQVFVVEPERENPYNQQWNIVVQRQLARNLVLDLAYVGSHGVHLPIQTAELNQISPNVLEYARNNFNKPNTCSTQTAAPFTLNTTCANASAFLTQSVPNPLAGLITVPGASASVSGNFVQRLQALRPYPHYLNVTLFRPHWGASKYHALQINLQKRFSDGLSATVNYTWSKQQDTGGVGNGAAFLDSTAIQNVYDFVSEYTLSTLDVPHRFVASWSYELPFGKKKKFGSNWGSLAQFFLGGWQTSGSYTWQTGTPIPITVANFAVGIQSGVRRPNRVAGSQNFDLETSRKNAVSQGLWFDPSIFVDPVLVNSNDLRFGTAARTFSDIRRDNYRNINLSLLKNWFWADGKQKLQLRAEFLNAFNWVVYGTPVSQLTSSNSLNPANACFATQTCFGQVRTQGNTPRSMQFVVRYTF